MSLVKEIDYLAGTENIGHSKLANPRLVEGQVEVSPWHHSMTQVVSHVDVIYSL